jgi:zinc protease
MTSKRTVKTAGKQPAARRKTAVSTGGSARAAPSLPHSGNIAQFELNNGIRIYAYENFSSPAVVINGFYNSGAADEPRDKAGLAGFATDCLMRGTRRYNYESIFELTESVGANLHISSGVFTSGMFGKSLAEDLPLILDLLADALREPTFPEGEVEKERGEWLTGLQERSNNTRAMSGLAFYELAYPTEHPFHYSSDGYPETARAITRDDVAEFHRANVTPQNMSFVVTGAVKAEEARDRIAGVFGDWHGTRPERPEPPVAPKVLGRHRKHVTMPGKSQSNLLLGYPAASHTDPDWLTCALMNSILGQFGMYGRLGDSVRKEEGLVYYIGSRFEGGLVPGPWSLYAGTNPNTIDRVLEIALNEMRRMRDKRVSPAELEDNKRYFTGIMPLQMETNEGIAGQILNMVRYNRGLDYLLTYPDRVNAVTVRDVQESARKWLDPDNYVLITAGP